MGSSQLKPIERLCDEGDVHHVAYFKKKKTQKEVEILKLVESS